MKRFLSTTATTSLILLLVGLLLLLSDGGSCCWAFLAGSSTSTSTARTVVVVAPVTTQRRQAAAATNDQEAQHYDNDSRTVVLPSTQQQRHTDDDPSSLLLNRRSAFIQTASSLILSTTVAVAASAATPAVAAAAAQREPLDDSLYRILRVREATQQESRLIRSGKFKDVQRANVKLAVKFMIDNYRLNDAFISSSSYLDGGTARKVEAGQVGQTAVQNLYTILEYFDSSDVENIKVGQSSMSGKEDIVLKGLDAARKSIDDFLAYFPKSTVDSVNARVIEENQLNIKEFDPALGDLLNMPLQQK